MTKFNMAKDNMGLNETSGSNPDSSKSPRGVRGFKLNTGNFSTWKVQGKVGGYTKYVGVGSFLLRLEISIASLTKFVESLTRAALLVNAKAGIFQVLTRLIGNLGIFRLVCLAALVLVSLLRPSS